MTATPKWVTDKLIADGDMTPNKIATKPQQRRCPSCGARCQVAIAASTDRVVWADLAPTTTVGELIAIASGKATYAVYEREGIELRFPEDIAYLDADREQVIHGQHKCSTPLLPKHPRYRPPIRTGNYPTEIPF